MPDPTPGSTPSLARPGREYLLVGRERERSTLRDALAAAQAGRGALVLIGGEAGIGKTALAEAALAEAVGRGALVLVGRCYDLAETPPYGPWAEALARAQHDAARSAPPDLAGDAATASQAALFRQVGSYLATLAARSPLVLLLDDLHWADPASLDLLRFLARQFDALPLLVLATYRAEELTRRHPLYQLLPALVHEAQAIRLDLRPLDEADLRSLVAAHYTLSLDDAHRLVGYLGARAEGNPFYVGEVLRTLEGERTLRRADMTWLLGDLAAVRVPPLLRQVIDGRVDRLGEEARSLLAVAAVIGQDVPLELWSQVAAADEAALLGLIERAVETRVLEETASGVRFAHALIREAVYEGTTRARRRTWHRRVAETLLASPSPDPDAVAYHFQRAGDARALDWLLRAAERAQRTFAWVTAAARLEAALSLPDSGLVPGERGWLLARLARLRRFADPQQSLRYLGEAARLAAATGDRLLAAYVTCDSGNTHCLAAELGRGVAEMAAGVAVLDIQSPADLARLAGGTAGGLATVPTLRANLAQWLAVVGRYADAQPLVERVLGDPAVAEDGGGPGGSATGDAYAAIAEIEAAAGRPETARMAFDRARAAYEAIGDPGQAALMLALELRCVIRHQGEQVAERRRLAAEAEAADRRGGTDQRGSEEQAARLPQVPVLLVEGRWGEARALVAFRRAIALSQPQSWAAGEFGALARYQGAGALARTLVGEWLPDGPSTDPGATPYLPALVLLRLGARLALDEGDLPRARDWLAAHDRWLAWGDAVIGQAEGALAWADYSLAADDPVAARTHAERAVDHATAPRQPLVLLAARRLLGEVDMAAGRHAGAQAHLDAALVLAGACAAPYERALILLVLAELRAGVGDQDGARSALDEARGILIPLDAGPALAHAAALDARLPAVPRAVATTLPFGLSAREVEVLRLVAEGLTNPQVAERLYVTPRTVNAHLTSIYTKLGVAGRAAAIRRAVALGLG